MKRQLAEIGRYGEYRRGWRHDDSRDAEDKIIPTRYDMTDASFGSDI